MVLKTATCRFSGLRIYPGKGIIYVRVDGNQFLFMNQKCKSLFQQRKRPAKIAWTVTYRKQHKKVRGSPYSGLSWKACMPAYGTPWAQVSLAH